MSKSKFNKITAMKLTELSLVDRPANQHARVTLFKRAPDVRVNALTTRVAKLKQQVASISKAFDPNQKRDKDGKWTSGGGTTVVRGGPLKPGEPPRPTSSYIVQDKYGNDVGGGGPRWKDSGISEGQKANRATTVAAGTVAAGRREGFKPSGIGFSRVHSRSGMSYVRFNSPKYNEQLRIYVNGSWDVRNTSGQVVLGSGTGGSQLTNQFTYIETKEGPKSAKLQKAFDPNQVRDEEGKWSRVGSAVAGVARSRQLLRKLVS